MSDGNGMAERVRQLERRIERAEDDARSFTVTQAEVTKSLAVISAKQLELAEDVHEARSDMSTLRTWLVTASIGAFGVVVGLATLILQGATGP